MNHISRDIVTAYVVSADGMLLLGKKMAGAGGVYPDCLHNPGGGVDAGETKLSALQREVAEETGIAISPDQVTLVDNKGTGKSVKRIDGQDVIVVMQCNVYRVWLQQSHTAVIVQAGDDLIDFDWYPIKNILTLPLTPPAFELFDRIGMQWLYERVTKGS